MLRMSRCYEIFNTVDKVRKFRILGSSVQQERERERADLQQDNKKWVMRKQIGNYWCQLFKKVVREEQDWCISHLTQWRNDGHIYLGGTLVYVCILGGSSHESFKTEKNKEKGYYEKDCIKQNKVVRSCNIEKK